jgi:predicted ATPase
MDIIDINSYTLNNLNRINIILGKNGCGKSTLLRRVEQNLSNKGGEYGKTKYITPERGGSLIYEAGVEQSVINDSNYLSGQRRKNQANNFRQQSTAQYKVLETLVLREIEKERRQDSDYTFDSYVEKINFLLDNIEIRRDKTAFKIYKKGTNGEVQAESISSGECELISLAIECLIFDKECDVSKENFLFLDEPDVHLHPDLQVRLMTFLGDLTNKGNFKIFIATHSTAILGALENYDYTNLCFMTFDQKVLEFTPITDVYKKVLPIFGAHPLSNIFNEATILLVEGEDDERIWQQAVRSSEGRLRIFPCSVEGVTDLNSFEIEAQKIIQSVYDRAKGYSLRDRDDSTGEISDLIPIIRMKLSCRSAENLILSDEVLEFLNVSWKEIKGRIDYWLTVNSEHSHFSVMEGFKSRGFDRMNYDIKDIRNDLMGIIGSSKPWEVAVGQVISKQSWTASTNFKIEGKILSFLGQKTSQNLLPKSG